MIKSSYRLLRHCLYISIRAIWHVVPGNQNFKHYLKDRAYRTSPTIFEWITSSRGHTVVEREVRGGSYVTAGGNIVQLVPVDRRQRVSLLEASPLEEVPVRIIAFYLPQYHQIPENDAWWGKDFTDWVNVRSAKPQFDGHYQPYVPGELGYYDLNDSSILQRQTELAKLYGVGGFCFYFYWFAGKRLLETPTVNYLNDKSLDLPFCLCWANENWTRRWDGFDDEVLITQQHSPEDDLAFIEYVSRYFRDPRYIRINDRPLLIVYRPSLLPSAKKTAIRWRAWCRENGIGEIYLAYTQSFETANPVKYGFDAAIEFPPNNSKPPNITEKIEKINPAFSGEVYDWRIFLKRSRDYKQSKYTLFRGVNPAWDNTARRGSASTIFVNSSPNNYRSLLARAIHDTLMHRNNPDERIVFINAWNEWAEGAYLEPDQRYGYAYLQATRDALELSAGTNVGSRRNYRSDVSVAEDRRKSVGDG